MNEMTPPTSSRNSTGHSFLRLLCRDCFGRAADPGPAALLRRDDEWRGAGGGGRRGGRVAGIRVVDVAVVLGGEAVIRLPAVALVLPLLSGEDAARLLHRVVVRLLDLRLDVVEVLREGIIGRL